MTPKALFFDVFGTLVDWRTSIAREAERLLAPQGFKLDWLAFAIDWRREYQPALEEVRAGRIPFCKLDVLHRYNLERILPRFEVKNVPEPVLADLNLAWHRLDAWPDVKEGFARLGRRFLMAPSTPCATRRMSSAKNASKARHPASALSARSLTTRSDNRSRTTSAV